MFVAMTGMLFINKVIAKTKRASLLVMTLSVVMFINFILVTLNSTTQTIKKHNEGINVF